MTFDHNNPLLVSLPYTFNNTSDYPTEILANRFQAWRSIIKDLVNYLKEYASVQEEIVRQQMRLQQAVGISASTVSSNNNSHDSHKEDLNAINKFFLPIGNGSIQDLPTILTKYHQTNYTNASRTLKELNSLIIPKLENLRKDLLLKIKEIKNLQNDFKNNLGKELNETKHLLSQFNQAIESSSHPNTNFSGQHEVDAGKNDPYLAKVKLERQLKKQLSEENYLYDAYTNLQTAGGKLESIVVQEIQSYLSMFLNLLHTENQTIPDFLFPSLSNGFLAKEPTFEWDSFIERNVPNSSNTSHSSSGSFIDLSFPTRKVSDLKIPNFDSPLNIVVREGHLERRSKFLKSYSSGWYVLTCTYLHEFKNSDHKKDPHPVMSLSLDSCTVTEHSKDDGKSSGAYKFILSSKSSNGLMHRNHNWVFRTGTYKEMMEWYDLLKKLTAMAAPSSRAKYLRSQESKPRSSHESFRGLSRVSSVRTGATNINSLKTYSTRNSERPVSRTHESIKSGLLSINGSTTNPNGVSSTFSEKDNQSPRLNNMINSDGTIITPVDTTDYSKGAETNPDKTLDGLNTPDRPSSSTFSQSPYVTQDLNFQTNSASPQQPYQTSSGMSSPTQPILLNGQLPIYIPSNQVQQIYDPVKQQYFIITPSLPGLGQSHFGDQQQYEHFNSQGQQHPEPQYFQTNPQHVYTSSFIPSQPQQVLKVNGQGYVPTLQDSQEPSSPDLNNNVSNGNIRYGVNISDTQDEVVTLKSN